MKKVFLFSIYVLHLISVLSLAVAASDTLKDVTPERGAAVATFTLWQLPNQTPTQIMSCVIRTIHGELIVIDGGTEADASYLYRFIRGLGGKVSMWIITHPHLDHMNALKEIISKHKDIMIDGVYGSFNDSAWIDKYADDGEQKSYLDFAATLKNSNREVIELAAGQTFCLDDVSIEILSIRNPEITANALNNSSIVFTAKDRVKSILFLGDLGVAGGEKLLKSKYSGKLHCDYVQMAHHGQNGVSENFYRYCNPIYCLWPTPEWLWNNDNGKGINSGSWKTLEVRKWMEKLKVEKHYRMFDGLTEIK